MPCYHPLQAVFTTRANGKKNIKFSNASAKLFFYQLKPLGENNLSLPCGRCMGCRLEKSRQWAIRCVHESTLYDENVFVTLTYDDDHLPSNGSLSKSVMQNFIKKLRQKFHDRCIRVFYCGEYGDKLGRPHYHILLFNLDFKDKVYWKSINGCDYFSSETLSKLWGNGFCSITDLTFESAAYVARYCIKKVTGDLAKDHYKKIDCEGNFYSILPEFAQMSLKPGIGQGWIEKFGKSDVFHYDEVVVRGVPCKPPRFYDRYMEKHHPEMYLKMKERRRVRAIGKEADSTYTRLLVREQCQEARMKQLVRSMEAL